MVCFCHAHQMARVPHLLDTNIWAKTRYFLEPSLREIQVCFFDILTMHKRFPWKKPMILSHQGIVAEKQVTLIFQSTEEFFFRDSCMFLNHFFLCCFLPALNLLCLLCRASSLDPCLEGRITCPLVHRQVQLVHCFSYSVDQILTPEDETWSFEKLLSDR